MKKCARCKEEKEESQFSKKGKWLQPYCKSCNKIFHKEHYNKNKQKYISNNKIRKQEILREIQNYKANNPCADCGEKFHFYAMDFDHLKDKKFEISDGACRGLSIESLMTEIKKCELVCSNCHRIRTYNRFLNKTPDSSSIW